MKSWKGGESGRDRHGALRRRVAPIIATPPHSGHTSFYLQDRRVSCDVNHTEKSAALELCTTRTPHRPRSEARSSGKPKESVQHETSHQSPAARLPRARCGDRRRVHHRRLSGPDRHVRPGASRRRDREGAWRLHAIHRHLSDPLQQRDQPHRHARPPHPHAARTASTWARGRARRSSRPPPA